MLVNDKRTKTNQSNQSIVAGSLGAVSQKNGASIAMGFMGVKALVMVDVSGSMMDRDAGGGQSRYGIDRIKLSALSKDARGSNYSGERGVGEG